MPDDMAPARALRLRRPLVCFDLETTGLDPQSDRIVEICCITLAPDGTRSAWHTRINPEQPIAEAASRVHGIYDRDVADKPTFREVSGQILQLCHNADLTGFNIERFDVPMLRAEFARIDKTFPEPFTSIIDSCRIFFRREPRDLTAAVSYYCGRTLEGAHGAKADAEAALDVLLNQVKRYPDLPEDVFALHAYCHPRKPEWLDEEGKVAWQNGKVVLTFGKHKNKALEELVREQNDYMSWLVNDSNMPSAVKRICRDALQGIFPALPDAARTSMAHSTAQAPAANDNSKVQDDGTARPPAVKKPSGTFKGQGSLF